MHSTKDTQAYLQLCLNKTLEPYKSQNWRAELTASSPYHIDPSADHKKEFIRALYFMDDVLWLGGVYDSGQPHHAANFRPAREWLNMPLLPPRMASGIFNAGTYSRSMTALKMDLYTVIESDSMEGFKPETEAEKEANKAMFYAFIRYAQDKLKMNLKAVLDTANKSLHAHFAKPSEHNLDCLKHMAEAFNLDLGLIERGAASPLRLPGCIHDKTGRPAELLYLHPNFL